MEGTCDCLPQRPAISEYKGTASSKGILMKRSATLMLRLLLVLGIAFLCLTIGTRYPESVRRAREAVLKNDLAYMRKSIDDFTRDRQQAPQSLQELVDGNYLRVFPTDPLTHKELGTSFRHCETRQWPYHFRYRQCSFHFGTCRLVMWREPDIR